jgi:transcription elongation GreA/GreB family factor
MVGVRRNAAASDRLYWELNRASAIPEKNLAFGRVRTGPVVTYRTDPDVTRTAKLVDPERAESLRSILGPLFTALIGVAAGKTARWSFEVERAGTLTVVSTC